MPKKKDNIIDFPKSLSKNERKVEAILFAASEPLDKETIEKVLELAPDAILYSSVGMCPTSLQLAQFRLAPIQMMIGGHPASSFSEEMDYFIISEEFVPAASCVSEKVIVADKGTLVTMERPEDCASRELEEEIGYQTNKLTLLTKIHPAVGFCNEVIWLYIAEDGGKFPDN